MPWHTIRKGDWVLKLAVKHGFVSEQQIWDHAENSALRSEREDPNLLHPGDVLFIPPLSTETVSKQTEVRHRFKLKPTKTKFKVIVHDQNDEPLANEPYVLTIDSIEYQGSSDGSGLVEQEIPVNSQGGELRIGTFTIPVRLGHLSPIDTILGVQSRLHNLGYDCGPVNGLESSKLTDALKEFQRHEGIRESGQRDDATLAKLEELHGC
jgi:hypothetical protein